MPCRSAEDAIVSLRVNLTECATGEGIDFRNNIGGNFMAIIAIFTGKGFTKDMYDRLRQEVGWETDPIDGWLMHAVCFDKSGDIRMTNIWESSEKMSEGFVSRLMPVMQKIGIPPPLAEVYPAYNVNVFSTTI